LNLLGLAICVVTRNILTIVTTIDIAVVLDLLVIGAVTGLAAQIACTLLTVGRAAIVSQGRQQAMNAPVDLLIPG
jgi:hypothetical protein